MTEPCPICKKEDFIGLQGLGTHMVWQCTECGSATIVLEDGSRKILTQRIKTNTPVTRKRFEELHISCPKCGGKDVTHTYIGYSDNSRQDYVNGNKAHCSECSWRGSMYELEPLTLGVRAEKAKKLYQNHAVYKVFVDSMCCHVREKLFTLQEIKEAVALAELILNEKGEQG